MQIRAPISHPKNTAAEIPCPVTITRLRRVPSGGMLERRFWNLDWREAMMGQLREAQLGSLP
jgi:hypothetical protein